MPLHLTCSVYARSQSSNLTTVSAVPPKSRLLKWPDHQWASWEDDRTNTHVVHLFRHHKTPYCSRYSSGGVFVLPKPNHAVCIYLHVAVLFTAVLHPSLCTMSHSVFLLRAPSVSVDVCFSAHGLLIIRLFYHFLIFRSQDVLFGFHTGCMDPLIICVDGRGSCQ